MLRKNFDFIPEKDMSYEQRSRFMAGENQGIGEPPKKGSLKQSNKEAIPCESKTIKTPPKKVG